MRESRSSEGRLAPGWYAIEIKLLPLGELWRVAGGCLPFTIGIVFFKLLRLPTQHTTMTRYPVRVLRVEDTDLPGAARAFFVGLDVEAERARLSPGFRYVASLRAKAASAGAVWLDPAGRLFLHALWADAPGPPRLAACSVAGDRHVVTTNLPPQLSGGSLCDVERLPTTATAADLLERHEERISAGNVTKLDVQGVLRALGEENDDFFEAWAARGALVLLDDAAVEAAEPELTWPPPSLARLLFDGGAASR